MSRYHVISSQFLKLSFPQDCYLNKLRRAWKKEHASSQSIRYLHSVVIKVAHLLCIGSPLYLHLHHLSRLRQQLNKLLTFINVTYRQVSCCTKYFEKCKITGEICSLWIIQIPSPTVQVRSKIHHNEAQMSIRKGSEYCNSMTCPCNRASSTLVTEALAEHQTLKPSNSRRWASWMWGKELGAWFRRLDACNMVPYNQKPHGGGKMGGVVLGPGP